MRRATHPLADLFPPMTEAEFVGLRESIRSNNHTLDRPGMHPDQIQRADHGI